MLTYFIISGPPLALIPGARYYYVDYGISIALVNVGYYLMKATALSYLIPAIKTKLYNKLNSAKADDSVIPWRASSALRYYSPT